MTVSGKKVLMVMLIVIGLFATGLAVRYFEVVSEWIVITLSYQKREGDADALRKAHAERADLLPKYEACVKRGDDCSWYEGQLNRLNITIKGYEE